MVYLGEIQLLDNLLGLPRSILFWGFNYPRIKGNSDGEEEVDNEEITYYEWGVCQTGHGIIRKFMVILSLYSAAFRHYKITIIDITKKSLWKLKSIKKKQQ